VAKEVNEQAEAAGQPAKSPDEVAMGFIKVANEAMCRPIRALTQMRVRAHAIRAAALLH
jgi:5-oxoprolinase (ATP-hydrolysing)